MTTPDHPTAEERPVWARPDAFPKAPNSWGWATIKGTRHTCASLAELIRAIGADREAEIALAWTPDDEFMVLPEEIDEAAAAVSTARRLRADDDLDLGRSRMRYFSLLLAALIGWILWQNWKIAPAATPLPQHLLFAAKALISSTTAGIALLMFIIFAFIPWYEATKQDRMLRRQADASFADIIPALRFETWLEHQKAPVTRLFLVMIGIVGIAQILSQDSIHAAGLVKDRYHNGEYWRLLTAPFLHGGIVHFLMNAAGLIYLGRRIEVFARWPHLATVFLLSAAAGGIASARFLSTTSVGASGGLLGWLGFLLVFESLHSRLVPRRARKRLAAGVILTAIIGLIGFRFIDNAAHIGGTIAGMIYAFVVFPKSSSAFRPRTTLPDRVSGTIALAILSLAALYAVAEILGS
ncbi:MAG: rhomboid family intramembrane serine protease [Verrucomicrobiota bacterium JB025]|nr:rhomboid family intramembrane serine protease [Verrucomicrobiota bacterium JB025]